ncbi:hypothetical protein BD779DRAFT_410138 [Infundibulicybe gibba]|nr:hypothetical protein BD779DRAFT_410138 [Infundibulicybe gibba]
MADDQPTEIFNLFVGVLAVMTTVTSCILLCRVLLPGTQIHIFSEIITQSKAILLEADAEGLIQREYRENFLTKINKLEEEGRTIRDKMCEARTVWEEYLSLFTNLRTDVRKLVSRARCLRAWIASHTAREKRRRDQQREALARPDRENIVQPTDLESIGNPPRSPTDTMLDDLESARVVEVLPQPTPLTSHHCQCTSCPVHPNTVAGSDASTAPPYIPIWRRFWFWCPSPKPATETLPGVN